MTAEEQAELAAIENGEFVSVSNFEVEKAKAETAAKATLHKTRNINIGLSEHDLYKFWLHSPHRTTGTVTIRIMNKQQDSNFNKLVLICSIAYPATALPQIIKVFSRHSAHDLSLLSWILYALLESIFLVYAVKKRLVTIIIQDSLWLIVYIVLIIAILLYGK